MSLDKAIDHGKEHRKDWPLCKQIDKSCRNHGGCPWCTGNRLKKFTDYDYIDLKRINQIGINHYLEEEMENIE